MELTGYGCIVLSTKIPSPAQQRLRQSSWQATHSLISIMDRHLTEAEKMSFDEEGYLIIRDLLDSQETANLQQWAQEIHDAPVDAASTLMPYEEIDARGRHILCRTENFANSHAELNSLLRGEKLLSVLRDLSGEDMLLFKEKINYKLAGAGGDAVGTDFHARQETSVDCATGTH